MTCAIGDCRETLALSSIPPGGSPEAIEVERALIGGCLLEPASRWPTVRSEHFYLEKHRMIWEAMLDLTERTDRPDGPLVMEELQRRGQLDQIGGPVTLAALLEDGVMAVNLAEYGSVVRRGAAERIRMVLAAEVMREPGGSERLDALLRAVEDQEGQAEGVPQVLDRLAAGKAGETYETGLKALDSRTSLRAGQLSVIAGRTSHGKTAFCVDLALRWATMGHMVDLVTLEDSPEAIAARMVANLSGRSAFYVRMSRLAGMEDTRGLLDFLPLRIVSVPGRKEPAVLGAVSSAEASIVIVDHLQQIQTDYTNRQGEIERMVGRLAALAARDNKAVILTCQLNREMESDKREPRLADIRDSGAVEQAARMVFLIYWPSKHNPKADPREYRVLIAKNSEGPTGRSILHWDPKSGRFRDVEDPPAAPA